jgi:membrane dipeptidase
VISRRSFLTSGACALGAPFFNTQRFQLFAASPRQYSSAAIDLVQRTTVLDMLGLLTLNYRKLGVWQLQPGTFSRAEFQRLKDSGVTIFHPAVGFITGDIYSASLNDITRWNLFLSNFADMFVRIDGPADIGRAKTLGRIGIVLGLQNSQHFRTLKDIDFFYSLGQRISQLTYYSNRLGGGSTDPRTGLTNYGAQVVERMNELGMAIDVSHCGDRTTLDAIDVSTKPVLVTHSNCRALVANSVRCKTDEAIRRLASKGGVVGITMVRPFVHPGSAATIEDVLDHMDHVAAIAGVEHVGLGTDVDLDGREAGMAKTSDLDGVRYSQKVFDLAEGLIRRKYSQSDIELILGGNFRRALTAIWT